MDEITSHKFNRLEDLIASTEDWLWEVDINGLYTYSSPQIKELLGYTAEEIIGLSPFDLMPKAEAIRVREIFGNYIKEQKCFTLLKNYNLHKNGNLILLESSGKPFFDSHNKFAGYRGIDRDISQREETSLEKKSYELALNLLEEAVLTTDPKGNIIYINDTFEKVMGYSLEELRGKNASILDPLDTDDVHSLKFSIETLNSGNKIKYIRKRKKKNGEIIDVLINGRSISDNNGNIVRLIGSYLDLSKIIETKEALHHSQQMFISSFYESPVPMHIIDMDSGEGMGYNKAFQKITGYDLNERESGDIYSESHWLDINKEKQMLKKLKKNGQVHREPFSFKHKNGSIIDFLGSGNVFELNGKNVCIGVLEDITKTNKLNNELENKNQLLDLTSKIAKIGGWELDLKNNKLSWTTETRKIHQVPIDFEPTVEKAINFYHLDDRETISSAVETLINTGEKFDLELRMITKLGTEVHVRAIGEIIEKNGEPLKIFGTFQDITLRRKSDLLIKRIARALKTLVQTNQIIIYSSSEEGLLNSICQTLVETGGYLLSWIGFSEHDKQMSVRPVAQHGYDEGYIESLNLVWSDTQKGQGPTGTAIRTGEYALARDILNDPQFKPWRERAEQQGYQSSIALPLILDTKTLGSINIYAAEPDAFDPDEIKLLQELASDVAYGIRSKRLQVEQLDYAMLLKRTLVDTVRSVALTAEKRDPYTSGHMERVAELSVAIGEKLGLTKKILEGIHLGAIIHDIGKIYIPSEILNRPGKLTEAEFEIIKTHPQVGHDIIKDITFPWPIADMVLSHHERLDGSGYPNGLKGDEISLEAQILAVSDVVEAVSSHRPYRPAKGFEVSLTIIQEGKGKLFNDKVVNACTELINKDSFEFQTKF